MATLRGLVLALLAVTALSGCGVWGMEGGPGGAGAAVPHAAPTTSSADAVRGVDGVQRVQVEAGDDLQFTPALVRAQVGTIEFTFHNAGLTPHDVRLDASVATGNLNGGDSATVRITIDRPGTYPFPCLYHASSNMIGTLIVS